MIDWRSCWEFLIIIYKFVVFKIRQFWRKTKVKVIINTNYGPIKGQKRITCWNRPYYSFERIPYARPPVDQLRFCDPEPPDKWTEVLDCTSEGPVPPQIHFLHKIPVGSEDCLYLNVFTNNLNPSQLMPVMVYIPGGAFRSGGASKTTYSPDYMMEEDVVIVVFSYRVGALGFLSVKDPAVGVPGNAGLKDQSLALRWIKQNCEEFGGDPENITVFGESAGGASVHFQMISEQSEGLFHKAILMSGCVLINSAVNSIQDWAFRLAKEIGYTGVKTDSRIVKFLRKASWQSIVRAQDKLLTAEEKKHLVLFPFGPVVEPYRSKNCMIPEEPRIMMRQGWGNQIPILIGGTSFEGLIAYPDTIRNLKIIDQLGECEYLVPQELNYNVNSEQCQEYGLRLKEFYFGDGKPSRKTLFEYLELLSDKFYWHGLHRTIRSRQKFATSKTFLYRFDYDSPNFNHSRILLCGRKVRGVCHGDDISYVFLNALTDVPHPDSMEYKIIKQFAGTLANFARFDDPNDRELLGIYWVPVRNDRTLKCINFGDEVNFIELPENENLALWDSLYLKEMLI